MDRLLRIRQVVSISGAGKCTIYRWIRDGIFPKPIKYGEKISVWPESEVYEINAALIRGESTEVLAELVKSIYERRKSSTATITRRYEFEEPEPEYELVPGSEPGWFTGRKIAR